MLYVLQHQLSITMAYFRTKQEAVDPARSNHEEYQYYTCSVCKLFHLSGNDYLLNDVWVVKWNHMISVYKQKQTISLLNILWVSEIKCLIALTDFMSNAVY